MSEKTKETAKAGAAASAGVAKQKTPQTVVYCGPTVRGVAQQFSVFTGGLPQRVQDFVTEHPMAAGLIVPLEEFAATRLRISKGEGAECIFINALKKELEEG